MLNRKWSHSPHWNSAHKHHSRCPGKIIHVYTHFLTPLWKNERDVSLLEWIGTCWIDRDKGIVRLCRAVCFTSKIQSMHNSVTLQSGLFHVKKYNSVQNRCHSTERSVSRQKQSMQNRCHSIELSVSRQKHSQCKTGVTLQSCLFHVKNSQYKTGVTLQSCLFHVKKSQYKTGVTANVQ